MLAMAFVLLTLSAIMMLAPSRRASKEARTARVAGFTMFNIAGALLLLLLVPDGSARTLAVAVLVLVAMAGIIAEARSLAVKSEPNP